MTDRTGDLPLVGKWRYMAPEISEIIKKIESGEYIKKQEGESLYNTEKTDVFSLGICIGSLCNLEYFDARDDKSEFARKMDLIRENYPKVFLI